MPLMTGRLPPAIRIIGSESCLLRHNHPVVTGVGSPIIAGIVSGTVPELRHERVSPASRSSARRYMRHRKMTASARPISGRIQRVSSRDWTPAAEVISQHDYA